MFKLNVLLPTALALVSAAASVQAASPLCSGRSLVKGKYADRVLSIFFENEDRDDVLNDSGFAKWAAQGINQNNYFALAHPSQPNYIAYVSGSTNGCTNDNNIDIDAKSIADSLEAKGVSWGAYAEGLPSSTYTGSKSGRYVRKHEPFISFNNIRNNSSRVKNIKSADAFDADFKSGQLPQFTFYAPDLDNDGHDTDIPYASKWLSGFMSKYLDGFQKSNTLVHLTFDETASYSIPNQVYSVLIGGSVPDTSVGKTDNTKYTHYSAMKFMENNWGAAAVTTNDQNANPFGLLSRQERC